MENSDNELKKIDIEKPVGFDPEKESQVKADEKIEQNTPRVGLEPVDPVTNQKKSSKGTKFLFVLTMLLSAAVGAFAVWYIFF